MNRANGDKHGLTSAPALYDWSKLNGEFADLTQAVLAKWKALVASDRTEAHYQRFLAEHAGLFFDGVGNLVVSQLELGSERRPDFVVAHDCRSGGLHYEFIELKRPCHSPYHAAGCPSQYLNRAMQQVRDWKRWMDNNHDQTQRLLPAKYSAGRSCSFTIVIGRRENTKQWIPERNQLSDETRVNIHSYDYLTDQLAARNFRSSAAPWLSGDESTLNQLVNPFCKALTDKAWRQLLRRLDEATSEGMAAYELHFLTCAGKHVVQFQRHNHLFDSFVRRLKGYGEQMGPSAVRFRPAPGTHARRPLPPS